MGCDREIDCSYREVTHLLTRITLKTIFKNTNVTKDRTRQVTKQRK